VVFLSNNQINKSTNQQITKSTIKQLNTMQPIPQALQTLLEQVQVLIQKIDSIPTCHHEPDENKYVGIDEIRQQIFPLWKKQTIYNKCCLGELPHSRIGSRLLFHVKECRQWRDNQIQQGKIKSQSQIEAEAQQLYQSHKNNPK
jgi:hypothetical protein